ncbi:MAG: hypothetical protein ACRDCT_03140 [Shewanella sp.]
MSRLIMKQAAMGYKGSTAAKMLLNVKVSGASQHAKVLRSEQFEV